MELLHYFIVCAADKKDKRGVFVCSLAQGIHFNFDKKILKTYKNGLQNGLQCGWYNNGLLRYGEKYKNGQRHDQRFKWYANGQLCSEQYYVNDKPCDTWRSCYKNGQLTNIITFRNGHQNGPCDQWDQYGDLVKSELYSNAKRHGKCRYLYGFINESGLRRILYVNKYYEHGKLQNISWD